MAEQKSPKELIQRLQALRQGKLSHNEIYAAVSDFGKMNLLEARPDVERLLTDEDAELRYIALNVLAFDWVLKEHWETALNILAHDPDDDNRLQAANALGFLKMNTQDRPLLKALAQVVSNEQDNPLVRKAAYQAMKKILHYDLHTAHADLSRTRKPFDPAKDVDWEMVKSYL